MAGIRLFVDDVREPPAGWHLARTVTEAIRVLATAPLRVSVVSVDHDIAHVERQDDGTEHRYACLETFEPVVRYIAVMPADQRPDRVVVHTANSAKAQAMADMLQGTGIEVSINYANRWGGGDALTQSQFLALLKESGDLIIEARGACWQGTPTEAVDLLNEVEPILAALASLTVTPSFAVGGAEVGKNLQGILDGVREARALCVQAKLEPAARALSGIHNMPHELAKRLGGD